MMLWHSLHSRGRGTFSEYSLIEPCGSWQFSAVFAHRLMLEQERSALFGVAFVANVVDRILSKSASVILPCGLWQSEQTTLPSRIGMCDEHEHLRAPVLMALEASVRFKRCLQLDSCATQPS